MPISQTVSDGPSYAADSVYGLVEEAVKAPLHHAPSRSSRPT